MLGRIVDELARREGPRILAGLIGRFGGNFDLAEDALQDAYERALASWPSTGIPERPGAWLTTVAQRAAIDKRVHAHGLRHAFAVDLEREGATLTTIRDLLGP